MRARAQRAAFAFLPLPSAIVTSSASLRSRALIRPPPSRGQSLRAPSPVNGRRAAFPRVPRCCRAPLDPQPASRSRVYSHKHKPTRNTPTPPRTPPPPPHHPPPPPPPP